MNRLLREHAPITSNAWRRLEDEIKGALRLNLGARKLVDLDGPHGWPHGAASTGRVDSLEAGPLGRVDVRCRRVVPLIELEARFEIGRAELDALERGAKDVDLSGAVDAAERIAFAEDRIVFHGYPDAGMPGILEEVPYKPSPASEDRASYFPLAVEALESLRGAGVEGPYGIALGPRFYAGLLKSSDSGGYPAPKRLKRIMKGPIVRTPALEGAVVVSLRGGDFELTIGQDLAVGYEAHSTHEVEFRLIETLAFRVLNREAAVPLDLRSPTAG